MNPSSKLITFKNQNLRLIYTELTNGNTVFLCGRSRKSQLMVKILSTHDVTIGTKLNATTSIIYLRVNNDHLPVVSC